MNNNLSKMAPGLWFDRLIAEWDGTNMEIRIMADSNGGGGQQNNPGNFANDPQKASEAGRKRGQESGGNFANDPERASEAGRKGGEASGGGQGGGE